jgi:predicted  nucleic acid-binding Zn-ribbon protein
MAMVAKEYIAFLEEKLIAYDKELQRVEQEYDKLEEQKDKIQKELVETRFKFNATKDLYDKCKGQ